MIPNWASHTRTECSGSLSLTDAGWPDPVHQHKDGSWFWFEETWSDEYGPFTSRDDAEESCKRYVREVLGVTNGKES